ncbi:hypothetical protein FRC08_001643 [Ceratobasidium sp. 394]|nr:hypothetical protein FRC08_001643 [Ceratobasidium sp. 394]
MRSAPRLTFRLGAFLCLFTFGLAFPAPAPAAPAIIERADLPPGKLVESFAAVEITDENKKHCKICPNPDAKQCCPYRGVCCPSADRTEGRCCPYKYTCYTGWIGQPECCPPGYACAS